MKNLYNIDVEDCDALTSKAKKLQSHNFGELWHMRLGYFHHDALNIMEQITISLRKGALE